MMRVDWLEDILLVADTGSFSAAAERRGLTKSAFSRRLRHIERQIGSELFDRTSKPARLHPSVVAQREGIVRALATLNEIVRDLQQTDRIAHEIVRIGTTPSLSLTKIPGLSRRARDVAPHVSTRVFARGRDDVIGMLLSRTVDLVVLPRLPGLKDALLPDVVELCDVATDHLVPFATPAVAETIRAGSGTALPVILYPPDTFFRRMLDNRVLPAARRLGKLKLVAETGSTIGLMGYVEDGAGVGWLPRRLVDWCVGARGLVELTETLPIDEMTVSVARLRDGDNVTHDAVWGAFASDNTDGTTANGATG